MGTLWNLGTSRMLLGWMEYFLELVWLFVCADHDRNLFDSKYSQIKCSCNQYSAFLDLAEHCCYSTSGHCVHAHNYFYLTIFWRLNPLYSTPAFGGKGWVFIFEDYQMVETRIRSYTRNTLSGHVLLKWYITLYPQGQCWIVSNSHWA